MNKKMLPIPVRPATMNAGGKNRPTPPDITAVANSPHLTLRTDRIWSLKLNSSELSRAVSIAWLRSRRVLSIFSGSS